jgi:hypothetical protein
MAEIYIRERDERGRFTNSNSPLADKVFGLKLYKEDDAYLRSLPREERIQFVRELIAKAVREKIKEQQTNQHV